MEFALIFPVFIMLTIGMISAGFAFERWIGLTQGTREAARYGATLDVTAVSPPGQTQWAKQVIKVARDATGVSLTTPGQSVCVALLYNGTWTSEGGANPSSPCWDDKRGPTEERLQVRVTRSTDFNWLFASKTIDLTSRSVARYEHGLTT